MGVWQQLTVPAWLGKLGYACKVDVRSDID
jgi:hypothetical protein